MALTTKNGTASADTFAAPLSATDGYIINGLAGNDKLTGTTFGDSIAGGLGIDNITGGAGIDTLSGGAGNDVFIVASAEHHAAAEFFGGAGESGDDEVRFTATTAQTFTLFELDGGIDRVTLGSATGAVTGLANLNLDASLYEENLSVKGNAGANLIITYAGTEIAAINAKDTVDAGAGNDTVQTGIGDDSLIGGAGNDLLIAGDGNDFLDGGLGDDVMYGGDGNDTYVINSAGDFFSEDTVEGSGIDTVRTTLASFDASELSIEHITYIGTSTTVKFTGTGNAADNIIIGGKAADTLTGGEGNDTLDGGTGNDSLVGGVGNDTYLLSASTDRILELADEGTDTIEVKIAAYDLSSTISGGGNNDKIENLTYKGGAVKFTGTGNASDNVITGGAAGDLLRGNEGNDTLIGGSGVDSLQGGLGNDIYMVTSGADVITEASEAGFDTVYSTIAYTLAANVEQLVLTANVAGTGSADNNTIIGSSGGNTINGAGGSDYLDGYGGTDIYLVTNSTHKTSAEIFDSGATNNGLDVVRFSSTVAGQTLTMFNGEFGVEKIEIATGVAATGVLTGTTALNVDAFAYTANALTITGNAGNNYIVGSGSATGDTINAGAGNDTLDGGFNGVDSLIGGNGNDTYYLYTQTVQDTIVEAAGTGTGTDTIISSATGIDLNNFLNVENLVFNSSETVTGIGNGLNNEITGSFSNSSTLSGGAGNDSLIGGVAADNLSGNAGNDSLFGDAGNDVMFGGTENDFLDGGIDNDYIVGDEGIDTLVGGLGVDSLFGGSGSDVFLFNSALNGGVDTIGDFEIGDTISLDKTIFAKLTVAANLAAGNFALNTAADTNDFIIYNTTTGALFYDADGSGTASTAVQFATVTGAPALVATDFSVVA